MVSRSHDSDWVKDKSLQKKGYNLLKIQLCVLEKYIKNIIRKQQDLATRLLLSFVLECMAFKIETEVIGKSQLYEEGQKEQGDTNNDEATNVETTQRKNYFVLSAEFKPFHVGLTKTFQ